MQIIYSLVDDYLRAAGGLAGETFGFDRFEANRAVFGGVDGEITTDVRTVSCNLSRAGLAD